MMSRSASSNHTRDSLSERAHEAADRAAMAASKGGDRIRHEAADVEDRVREAGEKVRESSDDSLQAVTLFVRDNPLAAVGIAFAAGALLSGLRRRS